MKTRLNILLLLAVAGFSLWCTGGLMRKNDQASVLAGAHDLAKGSFQSPDLYYQFDKTYVLYGVCAGLLRAVPEGTDPVRAANTGLALLFWMALAVFVLRNRETLDPLVFLCFLCSPAVLLNTVYVNSSVCSSAFLFLSAAVLHHPLAGRRWLSVLFFFLAAGARADTVLLLPLFIWLVTPVNDLERFFSECSLGWHRGIRSAATFGFQFGLAGAAGFALAAGRLSGGEGGAFFDPVFNWKMVAGYTVFGFGAAGLLCVWWLFRLAVLASRARHLLEKMYYAAGILALLLPVAFFFPQLHAPRYFWRGCEAVVFLAVISKGDFRMNRFLRMGIAAVALLPLVCGVQMDRWFHPRLTATRPTLFPSGDGFYPMGAYLPFMERLRSAVVNPLDHNQMVWRAVHEAQFDFGSDGVVNVLRTPMYGYFMFEASLRGGFARCVSFEQLGSQPFYADSRSLMRDDPKTPIEDIHEILQRPSRFVSPVTGGIGVLQFGAGDRRWGLQTRLLNRLFAGNEYRISGGSGAVAPDERNVRFSATPFGGSQRDEVSGVYYASGRGDIPVDGFVAVPVFPDWMSMKAFSGGN